MTIDQVLVLESLARHSYKRSRKSFELCSGNRSNVMIDASATTKTGACLYSVGSLAASFVNSLGYPRPDAVGGPSTGSDPFCAAYVSRPECGRINWFSVRKKPKNRGLDSGCVSGPVKARDRVVLFEDVLTTGGSLLHAIEVCKQAKLKIIGVYILVDREEFGGRQAIVKALPKVPIRVEFTKVEIEQRRRELRA